MDATCDTIVVGAGPAGAITALKLARAGKRVTLIDASSVPRQKVCGEYLSPLAWRLLADLGLGALREQAAALDHLRIAAPGAPAISVALPNDPAQKPAAIPRGVLDTALVEAAVSAGVSFQAEQRVREVLTHDGRLSGVVAVSPSRAGYTTTYIAPQIVAADGRHSWLVRQTGKLHCRPHRLVGFKRHWRIDPRAEHSGSAISLFSFAGGYGGLCPVDERAVNLCGMMPHEALQRTRGDVDAALAELCVGHEALRQLLHTAEPLGPWLTIADVPSQTAEPRVEGVLFVGDAMGTIEPLTGQGMTMAIASAIGAADLLALSDGIERGLQQHYLRMWHASFDRTRRDAVWFGALLRRPRLLRSLLTTKFMRRWVAPRITTWAQRHFAVSPAREFCVPSSTICPDTEIAAHG